MPGDRMTSRERMLNALNLRETDYVPCCFMSFTALRKRCNEDLYALAKAEKALGLDTMLFVPVAPRSERPNHPELRGLPVRFAEGVQTHVWRARLEDGSETLRKECRTPAGILSAEVKLSEDWPHGDSFPFVDDFQVPRAVEPLVKSRADLEPLSYLLTPPAAGDIAAFEEEARRARTFAAENDVLLAGGWGVGVDMAAWLCGMQPLMLLTGEDPELVADLLEMIHQWNLKRMEVVLSAPVDLYIRRAWYEGCDLISPRFFKQQVLPRLKAEADLAHERHAKLGYICTSGIGPILPFLREAGIDTLIGIDPVQGTHTDMARIKADAGDRICLWGGVSGAVTVELGTEKEIRAALREAIDTLGPRGMILSPVDNITIDVPQTWTNLEIFLDEWRRRRNG
jgi:uroporphyrinogen-III decarboxylase